MRNKKCLSKAQYYPLQYLGDYLLGVSKLRNIFKVRFSLSTVYVRFTDYCKQCSINNRGEYDQPECFVICLKVIQLSDSDTVYPREENAC